MKTKQLTTTNQNKMTSFKRISNFVYIKHIPNGKRIAELLGNTIDGFNADMSCDGKIAGYIPGPIDIEIRIEDLEEEIKDFLQLQNDKENGKDIEILEIHLEEFKNNQELLVLLKELHKNLIKYKIDIVYFPRSCVSF
jgi:hypothetical protein